MHPTLTYVHDPMCSWCYAFRPVWEAIVAGLPDGVRVRRLLGDLAPDNDRPMPEELRARFPAINPHALSAPAERTAVRALSVR